MKCNFHIFCLNWIDLELTSGTDEFMDETVRLCFCLSTTDNRLLRRMVRDNQTRGYSPLHTLSSWERVGKGEDMYVFPYQNNADAIFNTILLYEIGVLKVYAEPLLHSIEKTNEFYAEAKRLLSFLNSFFPISSSYVPKESLLREFIGEGYFK